jgi:hypothetical protein
MSSVLEREEYIEQAYFFRSMRERLEEKVPTQLVLAQIHEEILTTTKLPWAIQQLATELKHSGQLSSGFSQMGHYFTPFQSYVVQQTEEERNRFSIDVALLILEREAAYRGGTPTPPGLFVYQFETLCRNRLGYEDGLRAMKDDPFYDGDWRSYIDLVRRQVGLIDFADLVYLRSDFYLLEQRRRAPDYEPPAKAAPLFGEKEGKIAKASRGREPLYLFAALQRQLNYPEVPRLRRRDDPEARLLTLQAKVRELETRLKLVEGEVRGKIDLSEFLVNPDIKPAGFDDPSQ